ncbi:glycogenin-1 isoform X2 [Parasteatoda tepidariorum]|uniref:glycogenin-1 isoform X1 n=1 Tax=Parasteatoda tepidariorum TaxID=114398 RepID=UPI00077FB5D8|nr:glycogenin-1 isoform X1 [Parasteatoda tepidariorum]XP_015906266.1 glycogenin-1 isoform X2 [Parasteatoda tepidariorum]
MDKQAFVTCVTNDTYALGALVLAQSLRNVQTTKKLAVIITPHVSEKIRGLLGNVYDLVQEVDVLDSKDEANLAILTRPDLGVTFTKFHCWRLTQFQKCVFLDADILVIKNCDELFEKEELSAVPDCGWPDCFNSGVFVFTPNHQTYKEIIQQALGKGSFDGGDQGVLNAYFSNWRTADISKHLSFIYNMNANVAYTYQPAYNQFGKDVKIVHFLGPIKPWMEFYNSETGRVQPNSPHSQEHLQMWWDVFMKHVQPNLSEECTGIAGELSKLQLGVSGSGLTESSESRRYAWERGQVDYMGKDAFSNIEKKLQESIDKEPKK